MNLHSSITLTLLFVIFFSNLKAAELCSSTSITCNPQAPYLTHFPFWMPDYQPTRCGYPGFELSCNSSSQTLLTLPYSSEPFIVENISYSGESGQSILLSDPYSCIPKRALDLTLVSTPYFSVPNKLVDGLVGPAYTPTIMNCSGPPPSRIDLPIDSSVITCMSGGSYTVVITFKHHAEKTMEKDRACRVVKRMDNAAFWWKDKNDDYEIFPYDFSQVFLELGWDNPYCVDCVNRGGSCGFAADSGLELACFNAASPPPDLSMTAQMSLILGAGLPIGICVFGLGIYLSLEFFFVTSNQTNRPRPWPSVVSQHISLRLGLDEPTIESYPKTVLGESKRLPRPGDNTCPICLSEYEANDILRTIPECMHYFHADCIDAWLRMHTTCPLCRNSPQPSPTLAQC